jgi:hypothetical protein
MKNTSLRQRFFAASIGLTCLIFIGAASVNTDSLAPTRANDLVTLIADSSTPICPQTSVPHIFGDRLLPDGTRVPFAIPEGRVFVITSFDWVVEGSTQANNNVWTAVTLMGSGNNNNAFFSAAQADSIGRAAGSTTVPSGVAVGHGTTMCLDFVGGASDSFARLHGFLTPKR